MESDLLTQGLAGAEWGFLLHGAGAFQSAGVSLAQGPHFPAA